MKKKIAFITLSFKGGGAEKIFYTLVASLCKDFEILLITFQSEGRYLEEMKALPIKFYSLHEENGSTLSFVIRLRRILKKEKPSKILSFLYYPTIITYLSTLGMRIEQIPSERSFHRLYLNKSIKHLIYKYLLKRCYHKARTISVLTEEMKRSMAADFSIPLEKMEVIHNGINFEKINFLKESDHIIFPFGPDHPTIIAIGSLNPAKNYPLLLRSFAILQQKHPETRLLILGKGELESDLKKLSEELGIEKNVHFAGYRNNPYPYLAAATCYVMSSSWEGFPNALAEAMYVNGHVISTDCPTGPSEIISHLEDGILCPVNDAPAMAEAMENMCFDKSLRNKVYQNSRKKILQFKESEMIERYKSLLEYA